MCYNLVERKKTKRKEKETGDWMKKGISVVLILSMLMAMTVTACSKEETTTKKKKTKKTTESVESIETEPKESPTTTPEEEPPTSEDPPTSSVETDITFGKETESTVFVGGEIVKIGPHEIPEYEYVAVSIEEQEIWNQDGLTITISNYQLGVGSERIFDVKLDNQTGHPIQVMSDLFAVDGFVTSGFFIDELEDQTSSESNFVFYLTLGNDIGLWNPGKFDFVFSVKFTDDESTYKTDRITVLTSAYDENKVYDLSYGAPLYDDGTMSITALDYNIDSRGDGTLLLLLKNDRDTAMLFNREETLINGVPAGVFIFCTVGAHDMTVYSAMIRKSDLEELGISKVKYITFSFKISEEGNYSDYITPDPITLAIG